MTYVTLNINTSNSDIIKKTKKTKKLKVNENQN